jgi:hypothetical protein
VPVRALLACLLFALVVVPFIVSLNALVGAVLQATELYRAVWRAFRSGRPPL